MTSEDRPLAVRVVLRVVSAVVAVVVAEVVGLGLYLGVLKPSVLSTILGNPSTMEIKLLVAGNADVFLIAAVLAILGLAYAFRSDPTAGTAATDTKSDSQSTASSGTAEDANGGFAFGDGE